METAKVFKQVKVRPLGCPKHLALMATKLQLKVLIMVSYYYLSRILGTLC